MNSMKRQKYVTLKDEPPRSVGLQYTTGEEQRNSSRRNEAILAQPKWKKCPAVDVSGGESKVRCCKEQYCTHGFDPWVQKIPRRGNGNPLQYPRLENPMNREAWGVTVHGVPRVRHDLATKQIVIQTDMEIHIDTPL